MSKNFYIGVDKEVPIYETTTIGKYSTFNATNINDYFDITTGETDNDRWNYTTDEATYEPTSVVINGITNYLYTIDKNAYITTTGATKYWICGGGASGRSAYKNYTGNGGGGGYISTGDLTVGNYQLNIGKGGKIKGGSYNSSLGPGDETQVDTCGADGGTTILKSANTSYEALGGSFKGNGGSGGGAPIYLNYGVLASVGTPGTGSGVNTQPFGISSLNYHCAGGGSGGIYINSSFGYANGCNGGSNGSDGTTTRPDSSTKTGGYGGEYGGGTGGSSTTTVASDGGNATFYGGGGGGGASCQNTSGKWRYGGSGYQGVGYILSEDTSRVSIGTRGINIYPNNLSYYGTTSITLTAKTNISNVIIDAGFITSTEDGVNYSITVNGETILSNNGSLPSSTIWTGDISEGSTIILTRVFPEGSTSASSESASFSILCDNLSPTITEQIVGYETKSFAEDAKKLYIGVNDIARRIKKVYIGVDNIAQLCYKYSSFNYTGEYTSQDVVIDSISYTLYSLTGNGTLSVGDARYWMCGGGSSGQCAYGESYSPYGNYSGLGGSGGHISTGDLAEGTYEIVIGKGGAIATTVQSSNDGEATTISDGTTTYTAEGGTLNSGGSGGGGNGYVASSTSTNYSGGTGDGVSTLPFGIESLGYHCAGGGGGRAYNYNSDTGVRRVVRGGVGGSNGGDGGTATTSSTDTSGLGGEKGGGQGGTDSSSISVNGGSATFYGSGGGGGAYYYPGNNAERGNGGAGYQGIVYILVKD